MLYHICFSQGFWVCLLFGFLKKIIVTVGVLRGGKEFQMHFVQEVGLLH